MNRTLTLLSGEGSTLPEGEAKSIFLAYDQACEFESPARRILLARTKSDPFVVGARIAFARRVGYLIDNPEEAAPIINGHTFRFRCFDMGSGKGVPGPDRYLDGIKGSVDLRHPEFEVTLVRGPDDYLAVTAPSMMQQGWVERRPRVRPYFHPAAIFPKLSRALFNLSRCKMGETFLDPFAGTGSILIEAAMMGAQVVAIDQSEKMVMGALANMRRYGQRWQGLIRADSTLLPVSKVNAVATDVPYGRASSSLGRRPAEVLERALSALTVVTSRGGFIVLMHPQDLPVKDDPELIKVQEHHLYVHKLLTRTITVLRRR